MFRLKHYRNTLACFISFFCIFVKTIVNSLDTMKKLVLISLAALTVVGLAISCQQKAETGKTATDKTVDEVAPITIDGDFADWKALAAGSYSIAELPDDEETYPYLVKMMAIADHTNVYFYFEYLIAEDQAKAPFTLEMDTDNDPETGFTDWQWKTGTFGWDYSLETSAGFLNGTSYKMSGLGLKKCGGPDGADRWAAGSKTTELTPKGVKNKGVANNGLITFEIQIPRSLMKIEKKGTMTAAAIVQDVIEDDWVTMGLLPNDEGISQSFPLEIALP